MKKLLTISGYDSLWSFKSVTNEKLSEAEDFIEKYHRNDADAFEEYKDVIPFKFLPGHKALVFGIQSEISEFQENKKPKKNIKLKPVLNENNLQTSLLYQIPTYTKGLDLQADWSNSLNNSSFTTTESASFCTCDVSCPLCESGHFAVRYDQYWRTSNICKHLRKHAQQNVDGETTARRDDDGNLDENSRKNYNARGNETAKSWASKLATATTSTNVTKSVEVFVVENVHMDAEGIVMFDNSMP